MMLTGPLIAHRPFRILHLNPDSADRALLSAALGSESYLEVVNAASLSEFESELLSNPFDMVISSDAVLDRERLDVIRKIRNVSPTTEFVVLGERNSTDSPTDPEAPVYVARSGGLPIRVRNAIHCALSRLNLSLELGHLRMQQQEFLQLSHDLHAVLDSSGHFLRASPAARQLCSLSAEDLCGRHLLDVMPPDEHHQVQQQLASLPDPPRKTVFRTGSLSSQSGCRWIEWSLVRDSQSDGILAVARNVTEEVRNEKLLLRQTEARARLLVLSELEQTVLGQVVEGMPNKVIASRMSVSEKTVERYRSSGMKRLNLQNVPSLARLFMTAELMDLVKS